MLLISLEEIFSWTPIPGLDNLTLAKLLTDAVIILAVVFAAIFTIKIIRRLINQRTTLEQREKNAIIRIAKYLVFFLVMVITLDKLLIGSITEMLSWTPIPGYENLTISRLLFDLALIIFVIFVASFAVRLIRRLLNQRTSLNEHKKNAIVQISKYLLYLLAFAIILDKLHIGSIIFTSFAGLFVGLGFGLQQTFNDLVSGFILMFEGSVKVGDIIEIEGLVGKVVSIGDRYSIIQTRDDITFLVPNSKLIVNPVINRSGQAQYTRFGITVGVIYGSDVKLVEETLMQAVISHEDVLLEVPQKYQNSKYADIEPPRVYFRDFGDNSLVFDIYFWTHNVWNVDIVRSDIRFKINELFNEKGLVIAFPQRDVHIKLGDQEMEKIRKITQG